MAPLSSVEPLLDLGDGQDLSRLPAGVREALSQALGVSRPDRPIGSLLDALRKPAAVARLLDGLSGDGLYALALLAFVGHASQPRYREQLGLKLSADGAARAMAELSRAGLLVESAYEPRQVSLPATLQVALRPPLARVLAFEGRAPPMEQAEHDLGQRLFEDSVLLAALAGLGPKLTQSGEVFKRELVAMQPAFAARFPDPAVLAEEIDLLCDLGLVAVGARLEVTREPVEAWGALDRAEKLRRHALCRARAVPTLAPLWQLLYLAGPVPLTTLVELAELDASAEPTLWRRGRARHLDGPTRIDLLLLQPGVGVADIGRVRVVGLAPSLRAALAGEDQPEPAHPATPHLLPSLEAIVPPECPLPLLVELGRFLEVEALDTVARLKLTRDSVERAARRGLSVEAMLERLGQAATHGVPDNVARAVRDFASVKANRAHFVEGPVVVATEPGVQEQVRSDPELKGLLKELVPGVFVVEAEWAAGPVRKRLAALGIWQPREDGAEEVPRLTRWDPADASRRLVRLRQGFAHEGGLAWARKVRASLELAELGPPPAGSEERVAKARAALVADPTLWEKYLASLGEERAELEGRLERLLEPGRALAEQVELLDRLAPEWLSKAKPRKKRAKSATTRG